MSKVLVLYYSSYGHVEAMANAVARGRGRPMRMQSFCEWCCEPIGENYLRELTTHLSYCDHDYTSVTARRPTGCSKGMYRPVMRGCHETERQTSSL